MTYKVLSIAGFDGSGGAGLQADLKTFSALGCYGMTVLTGLPIQNTQGVFYCYDIPVLSIQQQLEIIFDDSTIDAIKIGMLPNEEVIETVGRFLSDHANCPIVLDPVMVAKSGHALLQPNATSALKDCILPISTLVTPNILEAERLTHQTITSPEDMISAGKKLMLMGPEAALIKGGHLASDEATDLFLEDAHQEWFVADRISTANTHGTGCTLSSAIAACLAQGLTLRESILKSKTYITKAIEAGAHQKIGKGNGPVHHFYHLWPCLELI